MKSLIGVLVLLLCIGLLCSFALAQPGPPMPPPAVAQPGPSQIQPANALAALDTAVAQLTLPRQEHVVLQRCVEVLRGVIAENEALHVRVAELEKTQAETTPE